MSRHDRKWMRTVGRAGCLLVFALATWVGTALAAEGDEALAVEAATPPELETMLKEMNDPSLSTEERAAMEEAIREYQGRELHLREVEFGDKPVLLGAPEGLTGGVAGTTGDRPYLGGGGEFPQKDLVPEEKALMDKVDSRVHELEGQGLSEKEIHEVIEREMGSELREAAEKHGVDYEKEMEHREMEYAPRETEYAPREVESHQVESYREPVEMERSYESPTVERSVEPATTEREYEKPPMEYEGMSH